VVPKEAERKQFFFEKKNQKTFTLLQYAPVLPVASTNGQKFFGLFFKKELLPFYRPSDARRFAPGLRLRSGWR